MVSIQSSSYGVSALVSSQMPAKNGETNPGQNKSSADGGALRTEGARPAGGPPPAGPPPPDAVKEAQSIDDSHRALLLFGAGDSDGTYETEQTTTWAEFEAATRFLHDAIDLREEDDADELVSSRGAVSFDESGAYRPTWIK